MKDSEWRQIATKHLVPSLPGFQVHQTSLIRVPITDLLYAISAGFSRWTPHIFSLSYKVVPLYRPSRFVGSLIGESLRDDRGAQGWWSVEGDIGASMAKVVDQIVLQAIPFFDRISNPGRLVDFIAQQPTQDRDTHYLEMKGYSLLYLGETAAGVEVLRKLLAHVAGNDRPSEWKTDAADRAVRVIEAAGEGTHMEVLEEFRQFSIRALKLEKFVLSA